MRKKDELTSPDSCMTKAREDEMTFVLLGRDPAAPAAIMAWAKERIRLGKNTPHDAQIKEALECAATMAVERSRASLGSAIEIDKLCGMVAEDLGLDQSTATRVVEQVAGAESD